MKKQNPTIKMSNELKSLLDNLKSDKNDSYENVIKRLVDDVKNTVEIITKEEQDGTGQS